MPRGPSTSNMPPDTRYGYTDQIAPPQNYAYSARGGTTYQGTCGFANDGARKGPRRRTTSITRWDYPNDSAENWDYLVFNDRDFSSVAELLLVPGCPPGLFTKQFAEFAPSQMNAADIFSHRQPDRHADLEQSRDEGLVGLRRSTQPAVHPPGHVFLDGDLALPVGLGGYGVDGPRHSPAGLDDHLTDLRPGFTDPLAHPAGRG